MRVLVILFLIGCSFGLFAQGKDNSLKGVPVKERIVTGGGFGLGFNSVQDYVSVSPLIGYRVTAKLITGTLFSYRYTNYKRVSPSLQFHDYGVSPYAQFFFYKSYFIQAEYQYLNYQLVEKGIKTRRNFTGLLAGGGLTQPLGDKASIYLMVLYNFAYRTPAPGVYYPFNSPWVIRAGINIGRLGF